ncbi:MAG: amidase family protein, partial [Pollutimonas bauzanensis]
MPATITELQKALQRGETSSLELTEAALARIASPRGEGSRAYTRTYPERALAAAQASDILRASGLARSPIDGLPISVKDLFDIRGEATLAGSVVLNDAPPAEDNALIVQRLIDAGAVIVGKTNMTEFAFSGLGLNPHYGTPSSPWDRATGRIPGGSSSGAGVSVADGMAVAAIGTDTGGSVRIPAALCGLAGFKPTARRVSARGTLPLSTSLDSIAFAEAKERLGAQIDATANAWGIDLGAAVVR